MNIIFTTIGHDQSRATAGSFREFYARQITRAEELMKIPSNVMLYPELVRRLKLAVSQVFAQYSEFHAAMCCCALSTPPAAEFSLTPRDLSPVLSRSSTPSSHAQRRTSLALLKDGQFSKHPTFNSRQAQCLRRLRTLQAFPCRPSLSRPCPRQSAPPSCLLARWVPQFPIRPVRGPREFSTAGATWQSAMACSPSPAQALCSATEW